MNSRSRFNVLDAERAGAALPIFALYTVGVAVYHRSALRWSHRQA